MNNEKLNDSQDVIFRVKRKKPRFKPGSELSDKVNRANIIIDDFSSDGLYNVKFALELICEDGSRIFQTTRSKKKLRFKAGSDLTEKVNMHLDGKPLELVQSKKKIRFKAGADLTDKVNIVEVDLIEEVSEDVFIITIDLKTKK